MIMALSIVNTRQDGKGKGKHARKEVVLVDKDGEQESFQIQGIFGKPYVLSQ